MTDSHWLAGTAPSLADPALITCTRVAREGGFDLTPLPSVRSWIQRVEAAFGIG